jgi:hypothetical protein
MISRLASLRMRNVSDRRCRKYKNTHLCAVTSFESRGVHETVWKNMLEADQPQVVYVIRRIRFAWCLTKATDTHSEYVMLIAFPRQQWFRERFSVVR